MDRKGSGSLISFMLESSKPKAINPKPTATAISLILYDCFLLATAVATCYWHLLFWFLVYFEIARLLCWYVA